MVFAEDTDGRCLLMQVDGDMNAVHGAAMADVPGATPSVLSSLLLGGLLLLICP